MQHFVSAWAITLFSPLLRVRGADRFAQALGGKV
jgi:hypothetical protein